MQAKAKTSHHWFQWHIYKQLLIGATLNGFNDALTWWMLRVNCHRLCCLPGCDFQCPSVPEPVAGGSPHRLGPEVSRNIKSMRQEAINSFPPASVCVSSSCTLCVRDLLGTCPVCQCQSCPRCSTTQLCTPQSSEDLEQVASRQPVGKLETAHSFVQVLLHVGAV